MDAVLIPISWLSWLKENPSHADVFLAACRGALKAQEASVDRGLVLWLDAKLAEKRAAQPVTALDEAVGIFASAASILNNDAIKADEDLPLGDLGGSGFDDFFPRFCDMLREDFPKAALPTSAQARILWERAGQPEITEEAVGVLRLLMAKIASRKTDPTYTAHIRSLLIATDKRPWQEVVNEAEAYQKVADTATPASAEAKRRAANEALATKPPTTPAADDAALERMRRRRDKLTGAGA